MGEHELSDRAKAMHKNLKAKGKVITDGKELIIKTYIGVAEAFADKTIEGINFPNRVCKDSCWNDLYHTEMTLMLRKDKLRV